MAAQNGKTGVPTGSLSDNHIFLVRSQTNLYIIEGIKEQMDTITNRYNKWLYLFHISSC